jgi:hypothetical protein
MLGGIMGHHRELMTEGPHGNFEQLCEQFFGEEIRANDTVGIDLWSALANVDWTGPNGEEIGYSFRAAGDFVAALKREGDYCEWYCAGPDGFVAGYIAAPLLAAGWTYTLSR